MFFAKNIKFIFNLDVHVWGLNFCPSVIYYLESGQIEWMAFWREDLEDQGFDLKETTKTDHRQRTMLADEISNNLTGDLDGSNPARNLCLRGSQATSDKKCGNLSGSDPLHNLSVALLQNFEFEWRTIIWLGTSQWVKSDQKPAPEFWFFIKKPSRGSTL